MSRVFIDKNPANIHDGDLVKIIGSSAHMTEALGTCPPEQQQILFDRFNQLMWEMHDVTLNAVHEATERRFLRAIQVGHKEFEPEKRVEIKKDTQPNIYFDKKRKIYKADVETPAGMVTVDFKEKK